MLTSCRSFALGVIFKFAGDPAKISGDKGSEHYKYLSKYLSYRLEQAPQSSEYLLDSVG